MSNEFEITTDDIDVVLTRIFGEGYFNTLEYEAENIYDKLDFDEIGNCALNENISDIDDMEGAIRIQTEGAYREIERQIREIIGRPLITNGFKQ